MSDGHSMPFSEGGGEGGEEAAEALKSEEEIVDFADQVLEVGSLSRRKEKERRGGKAGERRGRRREELWGGRREGWNGRARATCSIIRCVVCDSS